MRYTSKVFSIFSVMSLLSSYPLTATLSDYIARGGEGFRGEEGNFRAGEGYKGTNQINRSEGAYRNAPGAYDAARGYERGYNRGSANNSYSQSPNVIYEDPEYVPAPTPNNSN
jgi:hypothetical protein